MNDDEFGLDILMPFGVQRPLLTGGQNDILRRLPPVAGRGKLSGGRAARAAHDEHGGHGKGAEDVHQMAFFENRLVAVYQITDGTLGKLHNIHPFFFTGGGKNVYFFVRHLTR
ncbi:hypothetical protein AB9L11_07655 [Desulfovibrio piger]